MILNIPNLLTLLRIMLIPVFVGVFFIPATWTNIACTVLLALAAATDWLDGFLARQLKQTSRFGAFLDPVADKLMVAVVLVLLVQADPRALVAVPCSIIIGREIAVSGLREFMAEVGQRAKVAVVTMGKVKTFAQMAALLLMVYRADIGEFPTYVIGLVLLYVASVLTLWSMVVYLRAAWPIMRPKATESSPPDSLDSP